MNNNRTTNGPAPRHGAHFKGASTPKKSNRVQHSSQNQPHAPYTTTAATSNYAMPQAHKQVEGGTPRASYDAPRPTPLDDTSSFPVLSAQEGALISNRKNASRAAHAARRDFRNRAKASRQLSERARSNVSRREVRTKTNKRLFVGLAVAVVVVVGLVGFFMMRAASSVNDAITQAAQTNQQVVSTDKSIEYGGYTYSLQAADNGGYELVRVVDGGSNPLALATVPGTPVALVFHNGAFLICENLADRTWDVLAYTAGDGSLVTQLTREDGSTVSGTGELQSARLDGDTLLVKDTNGAETPIDLGLWSKFTT